VAVLSETANLKFRELVFPKITPIESFAIVVTIISMEYYTFSIGSTPAVEASYCCGLGGETREPLPVTSFYASTFKALETNSDTLKFCFESKISIPIASPFLSTSTITLSAKGSD
jgi:hypothetical protein